MIFQVCRIAQVHRKDAFVKVARLRFIDCCLRRVCCVVASGATLGFFGDHAGTNHWPEHRARAIRIIEDILAEGVDAVDVVLVHMRLIV